MQTVFQHKLESTHVIEPSQVNISILRRGLNSQEFKFDFENRDNQGMINDLGFTIAKISERVPGGILIFFPSYKLMEQIICSWEKSGGLNAIQKHKSVLKEPKDAKEY